MALSVNLTFNSFKEFDVVKAQYQKENYIQLSIVQSDKYQSGHKYFDTLVYRRIHFGCKYGKKRISSATKRNVNSYKQNCPFKMVVKAVKGKLVLRQLNETHNGHPISEKDFKHLPEQRRLTPEETEEAVRFLRLKGNNRKELQKFMIEKTNKVVLLTDINRIAYKNKNAGDKPVNKLNLRQLIEELCSIKSSVVEVTLNSRDELLGVYFQEKRMIDTFDGYPELVAIDASYHLPEYGMPVVLLLAVDGNGEAEVCCVWIVKSGCGEAIGSMCNAFKKYNPKWSSIGMLTSVGDRNREYSEAVEERFSHLRVCSNVYHVLRTFKREVTVKSCNVSKSERDIALDLMTKMCWADSEDEYFNIYGQFQTLDMPKVLDYFNKKWHPRLNDWVLMSKRHYFRYMNKETSKCESFTHKLRSVIARHSRLHPFFEELMSSVKGADVSVDQVHEEIVVSQRVPAFIGNDTAFPRAEGGDSQEVENQIRTTLTAFAYEMTANEHYAHIRVELDEHADGVVKCVDGKKVIETTLEDCQCDFRKTVQLPCSHIFAYRKYLGARPAFHQSLCAKRWLRPYLKTVSKTNAIKFEKSSEDDGMSTADKLAKINKLLTVLGHLIAEQTADRFRLYTDQCEKFTQLVSAGKLVNVSSDVEPSFNNDGSNEISTVLLHEPQKCAAPLASLLARVKIPAKLTDGDECPNDHSDSQPEKKKVKK